MSTIDPRTISTTGTPVVIDGDTGMNGASVLNKDDASTILDKGAIDKQNVDLGLENATAKEPIFTDTSKDTKIAEPVVVKTDMFGNPIEPVATTPEPVVTSNPDDFVIKFSDTENVKVDKPVYEYVTKMQEVIQSQANQLAALDEYNKDKYAFFAKNTPAIILEKFDKTTFLQSKIVEKFGEDFIPDASKVWTPGTPDYDYRVALSNWEQEATNIVNTAQNTVDTQKQTISAEEKAAEQSVIKELGLTEDVYDREIRQKLMNTPKSELLMLISKALLSDKSKIDMTKNLEQSLDRTKIPPGVTGVLGGGGQVVENTAKTKLSGLFGQQAVEKVYSQNGHS